MTELEQAQQQLKEVQATVDRLVEECKKSKEFEWSYVKGQTYAIWSEIVDSGYDGDHVVALKHGRLRKTKEAADDALALNMRVGRLHALAEQLGGLKEWLRWEENWYIEFYKVEYSAGYSCTVYEPEKVYMTKECAKQISKMLKDGTFKLEV